MPAEDFDLLGRVTGADVAIVWAISANNPSMPGSLDTTPAGILVGAALFFSCLRGTVSIIVAERERRTLRRLLVSPLNPAAYFLGILLALLVVASLHTAIVYVLAYVMGSRFCGSAEVQTHANQTLRVGV
jgi:ABC-type Na+ efflux pump permease subunit